jgi:rhodanese-related sulfurtransferase
MLRRLFGKGLPKSVYGEINVTQLMQQIDAGKAPMVIDVRSAEEFAQGHIAGARLLPLFAVPIRHGELPKDRPIVVTCRSGARSRMACEQLSKLGYDNLQNLSGGLLMWQRAGFPTVN